MTKGTAMKIVQRGKNALWLDGYEDGKRVRISLGLILTGDPEKDQVIRGKAEQKLGEYIAARGKRMQGTLTVHQWLDKNKRKQLLKYYDLIPKHYVFDMIDRAFVQELVEKWLDQRKAYSTINTYLDELLAMIRNAARDGACSMPIWRRKDVVSFGRTSQAARVILTDSELSELKETPNPNSPGQWEIKPAFLFACYTGLRWCDLSELRWHDVVGGTLDIVQMKTSDQVRLKIGKVAQGYLDEVRAARNGVAMTDKVFRLPTHPASLEYLHEWVKAAGITKHVGWHCARHTYATRLIQNDVEIYQVQKLLGHRDIKNTLIYAQISGKKANDAIDKIDY